MRTPPIGRDSTLDSAWSISEHRIFDPEGRVRQGRGTIDQIKPHLLWLGHAGDGLDVPRLHDLGIEAVVQLAAEEPPLALPRSLVYHRVPLSDGSGNPPVLLTLAVGTVATLLELEVPTLVICGMGLSRSPAVAALALARLRRESPEDALRLLATSRPVDISPSLWREVRALHQDQPPPP